MCVNIIIVIINYQWLNHQWSNIDSQLSILILKKLQKLLILLIMIDIDDMCIDNKVLYNDTVIMIMTPQQKKQVNSKSNSSDIYICVKILKFIPYNHKKMALQCQLQNRTSPFFIPTDCASRTFGTIWTSDSAHFVHWDWWYVPCSRHASAARAARRRTSWRACKRYCSPPGADWPQKP